MSAQGGLPERKPVALARAARTADDGAQATRQRFHRKSLRTVDS